MAAQPYMQSALGELTRAIADVEQQIHDLHHVSTEQKSNLEKDIQNIIRRYRADEVIVSQTNGSSPEVHMLLARIRSLHHDHERKKEEIAHLESEVRSLIQRKEQFVRQLQDEVSRLNALMGSSEAR